MKASKEVRYLLIKRLGELLATKLPVEHYSEMFNALDRSGLSDRVSLYELLTSLEGMGDEPVDLLFKSWLMDKTENIQKEFNKGRKLVRSLNSMVERYGDVLPFNLGIGTLFQMYVSLLFVPHDDVVTALRGRDDLIEAYKLMNKFVISVLIIDSATNESFFLSLMEDYIYINDSSLVTAVTEKGVKYLVEESI